MEESGRMHRVADCLYREACRTRYTHPNRVHYAFLQSKQKTSRLLASLGRNGMKTLDPGKAGWYSSLRKGAVYMMKGIVLAGGSGTRLYPITKGVSKQLLPVFDKPMIYYPISVLMLAGIRDILIITTPQDAPNFKRLLGDGSDYGVRFAYEEQAYPGGLAEAFTIGRGFIGKDDVCMVLGDNIFHGNGLIAMLKRALKAARDERLATVFGYWVQDPTPFAVAELDENGFCISLEEKPLHPKSNFAVAGLYFYPNDVVQVAASVEPSARGEREITSVNQVYLQQKRLLVQTMGHGFAWLDTGTHDSLSEASTFVEVLQKRQGFVIACLEAIAYRNGWLSRERLEELARPMADNPYGQRMLSLLKPGC